MNAIIVEDEQLAVDALLGLLKTPEGSFINMIGVARDGSEGFEMIEKLRPDLIFLDINIPGMSGLELLQKLSFQPYVVFTTAYDEFAVNAFELNSIDYLLKPVSQERFLKTIRRLKDLPNRITVDSNAILRTLEEIIQPKTFSSVTVRTGDRIAFISLGEVSHFVAEDKYVMLKTLDSKSHITSFTIQDLEKRLPQNFIRISRSTIVNYLQILEARKLFGKKYAIIMKDQKRSEVTTGGSFVDNFIARMTQ